MFLGCKNLEHVTILVSLKNAVGICRLWLRVPIPNPISDIGKGDRCTYLKIGEYSYAAIKFAFYKIIETELAESVPDNKHGFIESISFQGGKFDGQTIMFSRELNTLIGIRGSGKSSILEAVRYVLGLTAQMDKDYKESLVKNVFGSGRKSNIECNR